MSDCTCLVRPPKRRASYGRSLGGYAIYLDTVDDDTVFDPACPFHGDGGTMIARLVLASPAPASPDGGTDG